MLHHTRRLAVRRKVYDKPWYRKLEPTLVAALTVRMDLILSDEVVPSAVDFVKAILSTRLQRKNLDALVGIVNAVDRKAHASQRGHQEK